MTIVRMSGGLGNQMFQYALYKELEQQGYEVSMDVFWYGGEESLRDSRSRQIDVFPIKYRVASTEDAVKCAGIPGTFRRKILKHVTKTHMQERENGTYHPEIFSKRVRYLDGFWQSEKYFSDVIDVIRKQYVFPKGLDELNAEYLQAITSTSNPVAIHVRRGDYLTKPGVYGGICTEEYYKKAVAYVKERIENPTFVIFSNDIDWCREFFREEENVIFVEGNDENHGYIDMQLMSSCKHHIIANSSFSWWAAWIGKNPEQIVVAPSRWMNGFETRDIWCEGWVKI